MQPEANASFRVRSGGMGRARVIWADTEWRTAVPIAVLAVRTASQPSAMVVGVESATSGSTARRLALRRRHTVSRPICDQIIRRVETPPAQEAIRADGSVSAIQLTAVPCGRDLRTVPRGAAGIV